MVHHGPHRHNLVGDGLSYAEMVEKLRNRYGSKGLELRYRNELRYRRRRKDESLRELCQDINRLIAYVFPGEHSAITDHLAQEAFLQALDSDLAYQILTREPLNLDDAYRKAQQVEVSRQGIQAVETRDRPYASRQTRDVSEGEDASAQTRNRSDEHGFRR